MNGRLGEVLARLPRDRWLERNTRGSSKWLFYAFLNPANAAAMRALVLHGASITFRLVGGKIITLPHIASPAILEAICPVAESLQGVDFRGVTALEHRILRKQIPEAVILIKHGARLSTFVGQVPFELRAMERAIFKCRTVVVALLALKQLPCIARAVWSTRCDSKWLDWSEQATKRRAEDAERQIAKYRAEEKQLRKARMKLAGELAKLEKKFTK